jgi:hypothetical protein
MDATWMTEPDTNVAANYDEPWKMALETYFEEAVAFFLPEAHGAIDWEQGYEFLDKEFQHIVRDAEVGKRVVDKLVKVWLADGAEAWLLLHLEVQSQTDSAFAKRMFTYHYRIFDRYEREVVSVAVLGDEQSSWRPQEYHYGRWGCEMRLRFPILKLLDYAWETLEASDNPFALVVMAHRKTQETTQDAAKRKDWKSRLCKSLYERGYNRQNVVELFRVLDWMMQLPEPLALAFQDDILQFEEEKKMPYMTSFERIGQEKGVQQGIQQGIQEGQRTKAQALMRSIVVKRFGAVDEQLAVAVEQLAQMSDDEAIGILLTCSREDILARFGQNILH